MTCEAGTLTITAQSVPSTAQYKSTLFSGNNATFSVFIWSFCCLACIATPQILTLKPFENEPQFSVALELRELVLGLMCTITYADALHSTNHKRQKGCRLNACRT